MSGIVEVWRKERHPQQPVKFTVGMPPMLASSGEIEDLIVKSIVFRELKTLGKLRFEEPLFCINFVDAAVQHFIPASEVTEIAYETKETDEVKTPPLEA